MKSAIFAWPWLIVFGVACVASASSAEPQAGAAAAQQKPAVTQPPASTAKTPSVVPVKTESGTPLPPDFVLGPDDVLHIEFWHEKDMTTDVTVRPDGKITLPLLNDVQAAGLTPDQLRDKVVELAKRYIDDPTATIVVKEIKSRKVYITGEVAHPGAYLLNDKMTVLQLIALAGGLSEFAKSKDIVIMRAESGGSVRPAGQPVTFGFNYKDVLSRRKLEQNIELKPGDTVIVP